MSRERKFENDKQTGFAKEHINNLNGVYLTDVDAIGYTVTATSDEYYFQYKYGPNSKPMITKLIEVKYKGGDYWRKVIKGEVPSPSAMHAYISLVDEINMARSIKDEPSVGVYLIIETDGAYPFHVYTATERNGVIKYDFVTTVTNEAEYKKLFEPH